MRNLFFAALAALLVFAYGEANAAERVLKHVKVCKYSISNLAADAVLTQADGSAYCDVSDMVVDRVVMEHNITGLTGTNVIFKALTTSDPTNAGATTDAALEGSDGSTDFVSATLTGTGRGARGMQVPGSGGSGLNSNLGTKIGVWADTSSITDLDGTLWLIVFGRL